MLYTFNQPVRGGYYYIVVKAETPEEAAPIAADTALSIENRTDRLYHLSQLPEGTLILGPTMQQRLDEFGYAHRFVPTPLAPYHERKGHKAFLP